MYMFDMEILTKTQITSWTMKMQYHSRKIVVENIQHMRHWMQLRLETVEAILSFSNQIRNWKKKSGRGVNQYYIWVGKAEDWIVQNIHKHF